jgi:glutathione S-transferase
MDRDRMDTPQLILHEYPESPFSEKVRALFGYKQLPYSSVEVPVIMPKPDLTALTGGYRRTPVLQRGADVYCDTALIAEVLEEARPEPPIFDADADALGVAAARWTDSEFFRCCVGISFQPRAIAANPRFQDPEMAAAFIKDRSELTAGGPSLVMPLDRAEATFRGHLQALDARLASSDFLNGEAATLVDFSTWHCCWFIRQQPVLDDYFDPYPAVRAWLARMSAFSGAARPDPLSSSDALAVAAAARPAPLEGAEMDATLGISAGTTVRVLPTDYGRQPVRGNLLAVNDRRISIAREDERAGTVHVHFPRYGFEVLADADAPAP